MISEAVIMDNMKYMAQFHDGYFDLAVVDPPYGINASKGKWGSSNKGKVTQYGKKSWDKKIPSDEYFLELQRVSINQIIWGGNYFKLNPSSCWLVWDKLNSADFADCELAWTSFESPVRKFTYRWNGMLQQNMKDKEKRIHPTQKPIGLYDWIYAKYLPEGGKVLDTHLGSGSNRIAADKAGNIDFYSCEIDPEYFNDQEKRWENYKSQLTLNF
jgi:site-specific DNA-methyltransferase (adenine-specific)